MRGTWLPFLFMVQIGGSVADSARTARNWIQPSCEELRAFWSALRNDAADSDVTNEVPVMPWYLVEPHRRYQGGRERPRTEHHPSGRGSQTLRTATANLHPVGGQPRQVIKEVLPPYASSVTFAAAPGAEKKSPADFFFDGPGGGSSRVEEDALAPWGFPEDVGQFGRFVDFGVEDAAPWDRQPPGDWTPGAAFSSPSQRMSAAQESCLETINKYCTLDQQCACAGWNMRCHSGKCSLRHLRDDETEQEVWHDGPLPRSQLGLFKSMRKRSNKSILM